MFIYFQQEVEDAVLSYYLYCLQKFTRGQTSYEIVLQQASG